MSNKSNKLEMRPSAHLDSGLLPSVYNCAFTKKLADPAHPPFTREEVLRRIYIIEMWLGVDRFILPRDERHLVLCIEQCNKERKEDLLWKADNHWY